MNEETIHTLLPAEAARSPRATVSLVGRRDPLSPAIAQRRVLDGLPLAGTTGGRAEFLRDLEAIEQAPLRPATLEVLQLNLGKLCNMTCRHCHVDAGPDRSDAMMSRETVDHCLRALDRTTAHTVDLTGGAPELNPSFRHLVDQVVERGKHVIDRCNLTVVLLPRFADLPHWLAERGVELVCSLPHDRRRNTDAQRGRGTFDKSLEALRRLNAAGYGTGDPARRLTLMANPAGAFLAPNQAQLEQAWQKTLKRQHGVTFDRLFALNNMPIARFLDWLLHTGNLEAYMQRLVDAFNPATVSGLMCRNTLSVSWDGRLYDCDFNQMLELPITGPDGRPAHIRELDPALLARRQIRTARHCYGCTAGCGSSCAGATL